MLLLTLLLLPGCKDMTRGKGMAETAIVEFHQKFNESKYQELYAAAHADLKAVATEEQFVKLLEKVYTKLGAQTKSTSEGWRVFSANSKTTVHVSVRTEFEKGEGVETFSYLVSGKSCTLVNYNIKSREMTEK